MEGTPSRANPNADHCKSTPESCGEDAKERVPIPCDTAISRDLQISRYNGLWNAGWFAHLDDNEASISNAGSDGPSRDSDGGEEISVSSSLDSNSDNVSSADTVDPKPKVTLAEMPARHAGKLRIIERRTKDRQQRTAYTVAAGLVYGTPEMPASCVLCGAQQAPLYSESGTFV